MGQSASAYDDNYSDEEGDGSYYSSDEYSDEEEGYESESSSVMNDAGNGGQAEKPNRAQDAAAVDEQRRAQAAAAAAVEPINLAELSATELKDLVDELEVSREDLIAASRAIRRGHHPSPPPVPAAAAPAAAATEPSATGASSQGFYADDGHYATDVKVAMRILSASDHVRHLRFRLVPARLKEPIFWSSLLGILRYGKGWVMIAEEERLEHHHDHQHNQHNQHQQQDPQEQQAKQHKKGGGTSSSASDATTDIANGTESLRQHIRQRDAEVAQLRRALEASKAKIRSLEKEVAEKAAAAKEPTATPAAVSSTTVPLPTAKSHKGEWVMDRDSQDFLALDEELKANLRGEKAKRLRDVREQMRFILDTDDVACSNGEWSCCKKKEYGSEGCAR